MAWQEERRGFSVRFQRPPRRAATEEGRAGLGTGASSQACGLAPRGHPGGWGPHSRTDAALFLGSDEPLLTGGVADNCLPFRFRKPLSDCSALIVLSSFSARPPVRVAFPPHSCVEVETKVPQRYDYLVLGFLKR